MSETQRDTDHMALAVGGDGVGGVGGAQRAHHAQRRARRGLAPHAHLARRRAALRTHDQFFGRHFYIPGTRLLLLSQFMAPVPNIIAIHAPDLFPFKTHQVFSPS